MVYQPNTWSLNSPDEPLLGKNKEPHSQRRAQVCACVLWAVAVAILCWVFIATPRPSSSLGWQALPSQLSNGQFCRSLGFSDDFVLSQRRQFALPASQYMPMFATHNLDQDPELETVIFWLHGLGGNAHSYFCSGLAALEAENVPRAIGIAPWFGNESVDGFQWDLSNSNEQSVFWNTSNWLVGGDDTTGAANAFSIMDQMLQHLLDPVSFPKLKRITLAGFSAGAQLLSRWAFFSPVHLSLKVRSIVGDPGTFLYLSPHRPAPSCTPLVDTGPSHSCNSFPLLDNSTCPSSSSPDAYKLGLDLSNVTRNSYLQPFANDPSMVEDAIQAYASKDIRYMFGRYDVCNCNAAGFVNNEDWCYPARTKCAPNTFGGNVSNKGCCDTFPDSSTVNVVDVDCGAMLQGSTRLQRGLNYMYYLASNVSGVSFSPRFAVFWGGHDMQACYNASHFKAWAYVAQ